MRSNTDLSPRKRAGVAALVSGLSKQEAAATVGVRPQTVSRYMREPLFRAALAEAQDQGLGQVTRRMSAGATTALDVLHQVMKDSAMPSAVRVRAALGWLDHAWKARELNEITERIGELERRVSV